MANSVDQKIVSMKFDNSQFEKGVNQTVRTIDKLNEKLKFHNAKKGFQEVETAAGKINFGPLSSAVESIANRFNSMGIVGMTVLQNLTNSAVNAGKRIVSSLTIDPIKTGFQEYETQINAVQTILANTQSKGTNLNQVNNALDELNHYADKTIYNFTEMTRNIGTFTAAGVDLDTSVSAIKGIANLAAVSGSNSQQASTAMYQLSQALAAGTVKLMDWNSVVNAGMGGQVFQDALKETARAHNIAIDDMINKEGSFRETLQNGWLSSEILTETLAKFTGDLNAEQLKSMGYTDEQITSIMELGKTANDAATKVKTFTQLKDTLKEALQSGWTQSWEILIGDFEEAKSLLTSLSDVFSDIINRSSESRNQVLQGWKDLGGRTDLIESFQNVFDGLKSVIKPISEAFSEVIPSISAQSLYNFTLRIKEITSYFEINNEAADKLKRTFKGVFSVFDMLGQLITSIIGVLGNLSVKLFGLTGGFLSITASIGDFLTSLNEGIKSSGVFLGIVDNFGTIFDKLSGILSRTINFISNGISSMLNSGVEGAISFGDKIGHALSVIFDGVASTFSSFINSLNFESIFAGISTGLIAGLFIKISGFIKTLTEKFQETFEKPGLLDTIKESFESLQETLAGFQQAIKAHALLAIAIAVGILAGSLVAISNLNDDELSKALGGLTVILSELVSALFVLTKINISQNFSLFKLSGLMIALAISVNILASAVKKLSSLNLKELAKGLGGIGIILLELAGFLKIVDFGNVSVKGASSLILIGVALNVIASAVNKIGSIGIESLIKGLGSIAIILGEFAALTHLIGDTKGLISMGIAMTFMAASMVILAKAVDELGSHSLKELAKGLGSIALALGIVAAAMHLMPKNMLLNGISLIFVATSINMLAGALKILGSMSLDSIINSLIALGGALALIVLAMNGMRMALPGALALTVVSAALMLLVPVLLTLGTMSLESIGKSLIALAGAFAVLGIAAAILSPVIPAMLGLAGAVALLGVGFGAAGAGILALSAGLTALGLGGSTLVAGLTSMLVGLIELIPTVFLKIGEGLVTLMEVIASSQEAIVGALTTIISSILTSITNTLPLVGEMLLTALTTICNVIIAAAPKIGEAFNAIMQTAVDVITTNIPRIVDLGLFLILTFIQKIADNAYGMATAGVKAITEFIRGISDNIGRIIDAAIKLAISFINGVADGIKNNQEPFKDAVKNLILAIGDVILGLGEDLLNFGKNIIQGIVDGITSIPGKIADAVTGALGDAVEAGKQLLGINSPSRVFREFGEGCIEGFVLGLDRDTHFATSAVERTALATMNAFSNTMSALSTDIDTDFTITPTISPVVDLTKVTDGVSAIGSMFNSPFGLAIEPTARLSRYIPVNYQNGSETPVSTPNPEPASTQTTFVQNNYSPKALSAKTIYRQTRSQLAMAKGTGRI